MWDGAGFGGRADDEVSRVLGVSSAEGHSARPQCRCRSPNRTPLARRPLRARRKDQDPDRDVLLTWAFGVERVTGIEPALSAWEVSSLISGTSGAADLALRANRPADDRSRP
ncbi:hypothetical protein GCM10022214_41360 [Actinomadura miaoliensis]|uniref:Uncharacterized protein n=1 Tax=Actinomadura miaoliensis TaxID=430685 RepID=A0ABP7W2X8_9ACTN